MKIQAQIATVDDDVEVWNDFQIVNGKFEDGSMFQVWGKEAAKANEIRNTLAGMAGQSGEFEIDETKTKQFRGANKYRLRSWPGKPERKPWDGGGGGGYGGGGGGKKEYVPRYKDTVEGVLAEQDSIHRSVALTQAVAARDTVADLPGLLKMADAFYAWLSKDRPLPKPEPDKPAPLAATGPPAPRETIGSFDPLKDQKDFFNASLTTGDKVKSQTVQKYLDEFEKAVKAKDADRVEKLAQMVSSSLEKRTVSMNDIDKWLEPAIMDSRKALRSAEEYDKWYARTLQGAQEKERNADTVPF